MTNRISIIWPVVLISLPISALLLILIGGFYERASYGYWFFAFTRILMFGVLLLMVFNMIFSLYSSLMVFLHRSKKRGVLALLFSVFSMGLSSYFLVRCWRTQGVTVFTLKDKTYTDVFSWIFYVLLGVIISMSFFIAGVEIEINR